MTTLREHLEAAAERIDDGSPRMLVRGRIAAAIKALDESETAWRQDGGTYRLVPDKAPA